MTKLCQCCSKRYLCKEVDTKEKCNKFKSWVQTKNYGEMYPTKEAIWHFREEIEKEEDRVYLLNNMLMEINHKFADCNSVIVLEKGKVIEVL